HSRRCDLRDSLDGNEVLMTALVECKDLVVGYEGKPLLQGIDLVIEPGEILALLGSSGSGKSTLMRTMIGLLPPLSGEVLLFGESLYDLPLDERHRLLRRTGTAFQMDALFGSMTVGENVALPLRELTNLPMPIVREMVKNRLGLVGLGGKESRDPTSLSGGERKRAALARASILDPEVLFADEPSAGLDPIIAASIDETLLQFRKALDLTIVIVTHELESIRAIVDRAVMFSRGKIAAVGPISELEKSHDDEVYNFFHRVPERVAAEAR
ncbi:MAG TPA: ATP-binding cassette domain-containing protein, partial [Kofleriaceae bacterium]|nr:ATP-binding cassette domain-containing protein [Kofleriaceae bacterium]